jgi:ATP-dependent 26S proteasome regulatory subunit
MAEELYLMYNYKTGDDLFIYNFNKYNYSKIMKTVNKLFNTSKYYKEYDRNSDCYCSLSQINNNNKLPSNIKPIVNNIVNKVLNYDKLSINVVLYGEPGTGKSSCVEIISRKLNSNVYILPMNESLKSAIIKLSDVTKSVILIPELDKFLLSFSKNEKYSEYEQLLLEFLCGCYTTKNNIVIITCNDYKSLKQHKIMTRPGRVHFSVEFSNITEELIKNIVLEYFPDFTNFNILSKFAGKVSIAEFRTAVMNKFIMDKPIDESFKVEHMKYNESSRSLYM